MQDARCRMQDPVLKSHQIRALAGSPSAAVIHCNQYLLPNPDEPEPKNHQGHKGYTKDTTDTFVAFA